MNTLPEPRLPSEWDAAALDALAAFPGGRDFVLSNWPDGDARGRNILGMLVNHPGLAKAFLTFNNHVVAASTLSRRARELAILRISWLRRSEYEFTQHLILGRRAGLDDEELTRIQDGAVGPWAPADAALLRAVDELHWQAAISAATRIRLAEHFDARQMMDLLFTVGCYDILAMLAASFEIGLENGVEPLAATTLARMHAQAARDLPET
ncbi:MAG: carboxymuconolactone decarboxylase family protein [Sinimarinibacterium sp.]